MKRGIIVFVQLVPVLLSMLVIGAHFLRYGNYIVIALVIVLSISLFIKRPISARAMQVALLLSGIEWVRTAYILVSSRMDAGFAWTRLALILGFVALVTFASVFVFKTKTLKERYSL